jgi:hypothetical protein
LTLTGVNLPLAVTVYWDGVALAGPVSQVVPGQTWRFASPAEPVAGLHTVTVAGVFGSVTVSVIVSPKPTATPTISATPTGGTLVIEENHCYPNPIVAGSGSLPRFAIKLSGPAEKVRLMVYTRALVAVGSVDLSSAAAGWTSVSLPSWVAGLPEGTYYYVVSAERGAVKAARPSVGRLVVIK